MAEIEKGAAEIPIARSARLVIVDPERRVLLFRYHDGRPPFWATVGGRLESGESYLAAGKRELAEETGFTAPIGRLLRARDEVFTVVGSVPTRWLEHYFLVECAGGAIDQTRWTAEERVTIQHHHWWTLAEIKATSETFRPAWLPELLETTLRGG